MPTLDNAVNFTVEEDLAALPRDALQDAVLIDGYHAEDEPEAGFHNLSTYSDAEQIADDYGDDSDLRESARQFFRSGANSVRVMAFELEEHSETFETDTFDLENAPLSGLEDVTAEVDGEPVEVIFTVQSPPDADTAQFLHIESGEVYNVESGETETYSGGEIDGVLEADGTVEITDWESAVVINADTGEAVSMSEVTSDVTIEFSSVPWSDVFQELGGTDLDMLDLANHNYGYESIGDMDELVPWQDTNEVLRAQPYKNGQRYARPEAGMQLAWEVGAYAPSPWTVPIAHESPTEGLGGLTLGKYAVEDAGFNIYQADFDVSLPTTSRYRRLIGAPDEDGTFEGGNDGQGPANVLYNHSGSIKLSNSLTTAGITDDYRYIDRTRRKSYARKRATAAVQDRLADGVQFDELSQAEIEGAIEDELRSDVGNGEMFLDMDVRVPPREETSQQARANRIWEDVRLELTLNEPAHRVNGVISLTL